MKWYKVFTHVSPLAFRVWQRNGDVFKTTLLINFIPPLLEPVLYILAFGFGLGSLIKTVTYQGRQISYLVFMAPGVISVAVMFWSYFETTYTCFVRMYYQRTFDAIVATPLLVEDVIVGEWIWGATKSLMACTIMLVGISLFGLAHWPSAVFVIPLAALGGLLFSALGLITTSLVPQMEQFNLPTFILIFPMFLFSGTFFPIDVLPSWAVDVAWALPLTHVSSLIRGACLGEAPPHMLTGMAYLIAMTLAAASLALVLMRRRLVK
jgi:lipooligosaccharide transport system permease protein